MGISYVYNCWFGHVKTFLLTQLSEKGVLPSTPKTFNVKAVLRLDEWANFNAFVAMICRDLGSDYADYAFKGIGLALLNRPGSVDENLTMDLRALTASAWIQYCGDQLLAHILGNSQGSAENDAVLDWNFDPTPRLDKSTWIRMVHNFRITIGRARNNFSRERSGTMCDWMEQQARQYLFEA